MTLEEVLKLLMEKHHRKHISLRSAKYLYEILEGKSKETYIVFDNGGGMIFDIWKIDDEHLNAWYDSKDALPKHLLFGHYQNGETTLNETLPHWMVYELIHEKNLDKSK